VANEDKASRYHRLRRGASIAGTAFSGLLLLALLMTGGSAALRDTAEFLARGSFTFTVVFYVVLLGVLSEAIQLPLAFYMGVTLERRYDLSTQTIRAWWIDHLKAGAIGLAFAAVAAVVVWHLLRVSPEWWWLIAAAAFSAVTIALAQLAPVVLLPIFYEFKPLDRPALRDRLVALAERAGARVLGVFEWRLSDRTRKSNAALTGLGRTRRILLSDTLLADHSDDEIEVILAHELAHHVHRDMWSGIAVETVLMTFGFFVADLALSAGVGRFGIIGKADVAALPLLALVGGAVSMASSPIANALSRAHERRADRYALEMTHNAGAFVTAMRRLGARNLAEEHPSRFVEVLFYTHPPLAARIEAAQRWAQAHTP
jgi:STE24 endopeptidase